MAYPARRVLRALWCLLVLAVLVAFPAIVWKFSSTGFSVRYQAWFYGGIFVVLTLPVSIYEVAMHLAYYTRPDLQKFVIRISLMVPFYSLDAWLSLRFFRAHVYVDPLRECYEAFVIYSFYSYLVAYLTDKVGNLNTHVARLPQLDHIWGFQFLCQKWPMGKDYIWQCKKGILNYVVLRPVLAAMGMIGEASGFYNAGSVAGVWFWIFLINNFSQIWAIYCLIMFYRATYQDLSPIRPVAKFLLIKAVVFLTFWQSVAISIVFSFGIVKTERWTTYDTEDISAGVQDFFICVEMFFAALLFAYSFPPKDYIDEDDPGDGFFKNVVTMLDVRDVVEDVSSNSPQQHTRPGALCSVDHFEDGMNRSKEQVVHVTTGVVQQVGKILKSPVRLSHKWRHGTTPVKPNAEEEAAQSLLRANQSQGSSSTAHELSTSIQSEMSVPEAARLRIGGHHRDDTDEEETAEGETSRGGPESKMEILELETQ